MSNIGNNLPGRLQTTNENNVKFKILRISSKEINATEQPYNFTFKTMNDPAMLNVMIIQPVAIIFPNVANNVSGAIGNESMVLNCTGTNVPIVIPDGYYNLSNLSALIVSQINTIKGATYCSSSIQNNKLVFTVTGADYLTLSTVSNLSKSLGFSVVQGPTLNLTADTLSSLTGMTVLYVHSSLIANNVTYLNNLSNNSNLDVNGWLTVPVNVAFGQTQTHFFQADEQKIVLGMQGYPLNSLPLTLRTNGGRVYSELSANQEFILILKVFTM